MQKQKKKFILFLTKLLHKQIPNRKYYAVLIPVLYSDRYYNYNSHMDSK